MSDNMIVYNAVRAVPAEALKAINGGRLKGMSDINPMWRLKMLTELFGPCGFGWSIKVTDKRLEQGSNNEVVCFVDIELKIKHGGEWSEPIFGTGGSMFIAAERNGLYTSDECYKMAYTDAISVACKSLGMAADVYYAKDRTKYSQQEDGAASGSNKAPESHPGQQPASAEPNEPKTITEAQAKRIFGLAGQGNNGIVRQVLDKHGYTKTTEIEKAKYNEICKEIEKERALVEQR